MSIDFMDSDPTWPFSKAKTAVIRAAASVIREHGPRAATLKNIAARAGITEPAIFRHFEGVDGLFEGLFFVFERLFSSFATCFDRPERGLERFFEGAKGILAIYAQSKDLAYLLLHAEHVFRSYDGYRARIKELRRADNASMYLILEEALAEGELQPGTDLSALALSVFGVLYLTIGGWVESDSDFDLIKVGHDRIDGIRRLLLPFAAARGEGVASAL